MTPVNRVRPLTLQVMDQQGAILQEFNFAQEKIVIGRIVSADLKIEDPSVSRVHALIEVAPEKITVTDLASTHGTFVQGKKVMASDLRPGQELQVGNIKISVRDGQLDKVPEEFRESYLAAESTPPLGTSAPASTPVVKPTTAPESIPARAPKADSQPASTLVPKPAAKEKTVIKEKPAPKAPPKRTGRGDSFTQEIVRGHANVIGGGQCLNITVYWYEAVLDDTVIRADTTVSVGEGPKNDYMIPMGNIQPSDQYDFVSLDEGGATILVHPDMTGRIRIKDHTYGVEELQHVPGITRVGNLYRARLSRKDFAKISIGTLTFFMIFVPEPPPLPPLPFWDADAVFRRVAITTLGLFILLALIMGIFVKGDYKPQNVNQVPERLRPIIVDPTKPNVFARRARIEQQGGNEGEGAKGERQEGKRGMKDAKKPEGITNIPKNPTNPKKGMPKGPGVGFAGARPAKTITDKDVAKNAGILGALSGGLGKQLGKLGGAGGGKGGGGGNDPFASLMLGLAGPGAGKNSGYGSGTGLKGTGSGGGGSAVGIGGLGTKGSGYGRTGFGSGSIPGKGEADVSTVAENVQVLGSLDKSVIQAVINRYLNEIKYCYEAELQRFPKMRGAIDIGFTITGTGSVSEAHVVNNTLGNASVGNCVRTVVHRMMFPAPQGGGVVVVSKYPFRFSPGQ